ncbi:MAG TPA: MFS transporter [Pseudosphingobacterium sp.]|nr:MFS transporter [Pseudosphingobacterium sp.]
MRRNIFITWLIFAIFFVISFLTNILGPIIPAMIESFHINVALAGFLPFCFFVAYGIMSIPAGLLVEKYKEKKMLLTSFFIAFMGALLFACWPSFLIAMASLFLIGCGMAMLQVVINPLLRTAGGESNFAFNSVLGQLFFGLASFLSPQVYTYMVQHLHQDVGDKAIWIRWLERLVPSSLTWVSLYWIFALVCALVYFLLIFVKVPQVELKEDEKISLGKPLRELMGNRMAWLFFLGIFAYVGTEQGIATWISTFLVTYHQVDPQTVGATVNAYFWGLLTVGCLLGLLLLKLMDSRTVLVCFTIGAMVSLSFALFGKKEWAIYAFPTSGFFLSVMYSVVFSLALNSVTKYHGTFSGILCSGIVGGAVVPLLVGTIGNLIGLRLGMLFLFVPLGYIFSVGFWAKPLIQNKRIVLQAIN